MAGGKYSTRWIVTGRYGHIAHAGVYTMDNTNLIILSGLLYNKNTYKFHPSLRLGATVQVYLKDTQIAGDIFSSVVMNILTEDRLVGCFVDLYNAYSKNKT